MFPERGCLCHNGLRSKEFNGIGPKNHCKLRHFRDSEKRLPCGIRTGDLRRQPGEKNRGGCSKNCENSLSLETFADIAEWFLIANYRKSPPENGFEASPKDGVPLNCNLPASKGTMQKFNEPVRIAPFRSLTNSRPMEIGKPSSNAGFPRARMTGLQKFLLLTRRASPRGIREAVRRGTTPPRPGRPCPADTVSPCCRQAPHGGDNGSSIPDTL